MSATIIFKPIEANIPNKYTKSSYCTVMIGDQNDKTEPSRQEGNNPQWQDSITFTIDQSQPTCVVELRDNSDDSTDNKIASFELNIKELEEEAYVKRWYSLCNNGETEGEILIEVMYLIGNRNEKVKVDIEALLDSDQNQASTIDEIEMDEFGEYQTA